MAQTDSLDDADRVVVTPPEVLVLLVTGGGTVGGVIWGGVEYGILGAVLGLPAGAAIGFLASYVILTVLYATVLPTGILWSKGSSGLRAFIRDAWGMSRNQTPPTTPPTDTNSSAG